MIVKTKIELEAKADPNIPNDAAQGTVTPIMEACREQHLAVVKLLASAEGIELNAVSTKWGGKTALDYAERGDSGSAWIASGALSLQWALDRALAEEHTTGAAATMLSAGGSELRAANLPLQSYKSSFKPGSSYLLYIIPFYITFGIAYIGPYMHKDRAEQVHML